MEVKQVESWDDFDAEVQTLARLREEKKKAGSNVSNILFRGQSDAKWHLDTTLERIMGNKQRLTKYYKLISSVQSRIETFTGELWDIPDVPEYMQKMESYDSMGGGEFPAYEYMVYLRHHGFPSPLLDWSRSPYVAAYFAFRELQSKADSVGIFAYIEHLGVKTGWAAGPNIRNLGSYIRSDKRHFLQQCEYTICTSIENNKAYYHNHEDVFSGRSSQSQRQDVLWKFILPSSEQSAALKKLETYNINAYSLFGSEESLMEAVFFRERFEE
jgi:FRG domain